jgi:hypothetical protein
VLREKALRGDARALDRLLELAQRFNNEPTETGPSQALADDDRAILAAYAAECVAAASAPATVEVRDNPAPHVRVSSNKTEPK